MVAQRTEPELDEAMARLVDRGLVFAAGAKPQATFLFKPNFDSIVGELEHFQCLAGGRRVLSTTPTCSWPSSLG